jgi:hypothetical protein
VLAAVNPVKEEMPLSLESLAADAVSIEPAAMPTKEDVMEVPCLHQKSLDSGAISDWCANALLEFEFALQIQKHRPNFIRSLPILTGPADDHGYQP